VKRAVETHRLRRLANSNMTEPNSIPVQHHDGASKTSSIAVHGPISSQSYDILVPLPDAKAVEYEGLDILRLLRTPLAIAEDRDGSVTVASIVTAPSEINLDTASDASFPAEMSRVIDVARDRVATVVDAVADRHEDVPVSGKVIVGHVPDDVLTGYTTGDRYDGVFFAQTRGSAQALWDQSVISAVLETATCAVYHETLGTETDLSAATAQAEMHGNGSLPKADSASILLAVGTGPHSVLGAETARALGSTYGANVHALHLFESTDPERLRRGRKALDLAEYVLSDLPDAECESRETDDVAADLLRESEKYDVAILGAPTKDPLLDRLLGRSVPDQLEPQPTTSILTVRQPSDALDSVYYRWKRATEGTSVRKDSPSMEEGF